MLSFETTRMASAIYAGIGTPVSLALLAALERGDWDTIARTRVSPREYTSSKDYYPDAIAASLLRKCIDLPSTIDTRREALVKWFEGEASCYRANERLAPYLEGKTHPLCDEAVMSHIDSIREKIVRVIGSAPPRDGRLNPKHGPGATFSDKSVEATLPHKMTSVPSVTNTAFWFLLNWVGTAWGQGCLQRGVIPSTVRGNRFAVAPKDATTGRAIGAEPSINIFYQLPHGKEIRRCLKTIGIDLTSGQSTHARYARDASITGLDATQDLKNASETVCYNLVKLFMPPAWFTSLSELRSPFTWVSAADRGSVYPGTGSGWHKLEKFSSMGNGFTFELETLIFWAIVDEAVKNSYLDNPRRTLVYGDDIIHDARASRSVVAALRFFGFEVNDEKSFTTGPFRESCGGDFWEGRPVRPFHLKKSLDEPQDFIGASNMVSKIEQRLDGCLGRFSHVRAQLQYSVPTRVRRCVGPSGLGDIVFHDDDERNWSWASAKKERVRAYLPVKHHQVLLEEFPPETLFALVLYGIDINLGYVNPRDSVESYDVRKVPVNMCEWLPATKCRPHWDIPIHDYPRALARPGPEAKCVRVKG